MSKVNRMFVKRRGGYHGKSEKNTCPGMEL